MRDFSITLDNKEYKCTTTSTNGNGEFSYDIIVKHGEVSTHIRIPIGNKITRAKVILFIEAFHEAMHKAFEDQKLDQNYIWNQKTSIS